MLGLKAAIELGKALYMEELDAEASTVLKQIEDAGAFATYWGHLPMHQQEQCTQIMTQLGLTVPGSISSGKHRP